MSPQTPSPSSTGTAAMGTDTSATSPGQNDPSDSKSSTLYLFHHPPSMFLTNSSTSYTFLATVFVLLLISSSIVLRSFIVRRRFRRRYEHALANGILTELDGATLAGVTRDFGIDGLGGGLARAKPLLWESVIPLEGTNRCTHTYPDEKRSTQNDINTWTNIMPVALHIIRSSLSPSPPSSPGSPNTQQNQVHTFLSRLRLHHPGPRSDRPSSPERARNDTDLVGSDDGRTADTLSVSVLIAMPDVFAPARPPSMHTAREARGEGKDSHQQNHSQVPSQSSPQHGPIPSASGDIARGLPLVEFGVAEVEAIGIGEVIRFGGVCSSVHEGPPVFSTRAALVYMSIEDPKDPTASINVDDKGMGVMNGYTSSKPPTHGKENLLPFPELLRRDHVHDNMAVVTIPVPY
ncbi:hypothetical protein PAXRUDRAFT_27900 [Paxillus rubicundulus Ve08.2h10]|uniref:Uncharacterized protein n=1 Tax=Paxillus rubicundulus Ve08.2h10 TaxID=930991 RepID=A0A0D0DIH4_9AGAM|nr:hypothetical protein PAXRUDRAFT_27900 [Paxillus rubicundulus Ve08.2h10]